MSSVQGRAEVSCQRCYRRKKRCDKLLPECNGCQKANVPCSFPESLQEAFFSIEYVRGLERRVAELEARLTEVTITPTKRNGLNGSTMGKDEAGDLQPPDFNSPTTMLNDPPHTIAPSTSPYRHKRSTSLADGLKMLSLEATAERYVGSSSGVAFAKLTQTVLSRLSPDQDAFVFGDEEPDQRGGDTLNSLDSMLDPDSFFLDLDMMLDSPQHLLSAPIDPALQGSDDPLDLSHMDAGHITSLLDFYFAHSHTLYPIIQQELFIQTLWIAYSDPLNALALSPLWLFRIWMVLAIGSTTYCSVTLMDETESIQLFKKAMSYFEAAMGCGEMAALEVLMLQVSYSFFNSAGPNTWFLVGVAARMAIGMGLHTSDVYESLTPDAADYQKRLFFSLYMMDRVVSMALGRPFAIQDDDITVEPFADTDDENITPDGILPTRKLGPSGMAVPLHILQLREIASMIGTKIHSSRQQSVQGVSEDIHKRLIEWRRSMPFPLPDSTSKVPHLCTSWFDLNYYTHLIMLYRPSNAQMAINSRTVEVLSESSGMAIREANNLARQQRFAFNWLNLMTVFNAALTLIYSTTALPETMPSVISVMVLLDQFCRKFPSAVQIQNMIRTVLEKLGPQSEVKICN
ncbi:Zn(II)2Cys6 transcription factor [Aspergillus stella-maris]|uniref:Zn(II)2Cys6 transcription factor n=1 Tax=Aspergillus stella-maris TaxID=1810926 RepID=UPI003CCC9540